MTIKFISTEGHCPVIQFTPADIDAGHPRSYQAWSDPDNSFRPDIFELEGAMTARISRSFTASVERLQFVVDLVDPWENSSSYDYRQRYRRLPGFAGYMYHHVPSGMWELYPRERVIACSLQEDGPLNLDNYNRNACAGFPVPGKNNASRRLAALCLIAQSDELTRVGVCCDFSPDKYLRYGNYKIKGLGEKVDHFETLRPGPGSIPVRVHGNRQFLCAGKTGDSFRVIVESFAHSGGGLDLRAFAVPILGRTMPKFSRGLLDFCISRCRHG